jgi:lambda family phage portal protein
MRKQSLILDKWGQPYAATGFTSSGSSKRSMKGWNPSANSADRDVIPYLNSLRASSRDLSMNSPIAGATLNRLKDSVVGHGIYLQSRIDREYLNLDPDQAEAWERNTEREFSLLANSKEIDAERTSNFYALQILIYYSKLLSGDVFWLPLQIPRTGVPYDLRIKTLEADLVSNPNNQMDTETIAGGIEVDENGAPVKYHVSKKHPGGLLVVSNEWYTVDAYAKRTGMRQMFHVYDKLRPGQRRGYPLLSPVIESLKQITRLTESELMAAVVSSFFTAFIKTESGEELDVDFDEDEGVKQNSANQNQKEMGPGTVVQLANGESIDLASPNRPNGAFEPFFNTMVSEISASCSIPYEVVTLRFMSSYSAARAALLMAWKVFLNHRIDCAREFCQPVYERFLLEAVLRKRIIAPGFIENLAIRQAWSKSTWLGQGMGQINPLVETKAARERIDARLSTRSKEVAMADGDDWDAMIDQGAREEVIIKNKFPQSQPAPISKDDTVQQNNGDDE